MTVLSVFGASAPPGTYQVFTDGTPSIRLGSRFYRFNGLEGAAIVGGRVWVPAAVPGATGVRIMLWVDSQPMQAAPTQTVEVPLSGTGWHEGTFPVATPIPAQSVLWRIGYEFVGNDDAYVFSSNVRPDLNNQPIITGALVLSEEKSLFRIGATAEQQASTYSIGYGIDALVDDGSGPPPEPNVGPAANAGADQEVTAGTQVTLTGSGTDSDGSVIGYSWTQTGGSAVVLSGAGASRTFTPATAGQRTFRLTVTDDDGATAQDTVAVNVLAVEAPASGDLPRSTVDPSEFDVEFKAGFGKLLAEEGLGVWGGPFGASQVGIVDGALPATPENVLALGSYSVSDDPTNSDSVIGLQVTARAKGQDPRGTERLTAKVYDQLHGLTNVLLPGGVYVVQCHRQSWTSLGQDENNRWREVSNFYVTVHRPSKYRI